MSASSGARRHGAVFKRPALGARRELRTRLRARLRRAPLDRQLAAGEPPWASPELSRRASEITARGGRRALADQIDALVDEVIAPPRRRGAAAPVDRDGVRACLRLFVELAGDLRRAERIRPQGVALLRVLLRDGGSALYSPGASRALQAALIEARDALLLD
jgi:hypothetical protein